MAKNPFDISLLEIIEALEGDIELNKQCDVAAVQVLFEKVERSAIKILDVSLAELMLMQQKYDNQILFHI